MELSAEQRRAVEVRGKGVLVAAAAGSGKTSVLVERVVGLICDPQTPIDVDRLLVVTFTEAAAQEMRERIGRRLEAAGERAGADAMHIDRQLTLLGRASISTLHAFCLGVVREHFHRLDLDPTVGVMGQHEMMLARTEAVERMLADRYDGGDPDFRALLEAYGGTRSARSLGELVLELHGYAWTLPRPEAWLTARVADFEIGSGVAVEDLPGWPAMLRTVRIGLSQARSELDRALAVACQPGGPEAHAPAIREWMASIEGAVEACESKLGFEPLGAVVAAIEFPRVAPAKGADEVLKKRADRSRTRAKEIVKRLRERFLDVPAERWLEDHRALAQPLATLASLVTDFDRRYRALKRRRNVMDFSDLERFALEALGSFSEERGIFEPTEVALGLREHYAEVLVDEYQDVNELQEVLLSLVSQPADGTADGAAGASPNRFIVGDVKQSIYGFRHTTPELFQARFESYADDPQGERIVLGRNYRSRANVIDGVNALFTRLMTGAAGGVLYDTDHALVLGAMDYPEVQHAPVELHLVPRDREESGDGLDDMVAVEREALVVADRIRALVEGDPASDVAPAEVYDRDTGCMRPARWRDVVILLRTPRGKANVFLDVLARAEVPAHAELGTGWFAATEIETVLSLLAVIDNPRQDVALAAVLRSPLVGLDVSQLARIRIHRRDGCFVEAVRAIATTDPASVTETSPGADLVHVLRDFLERLDGWRTAARRGPLSGLVGKIFDETRFPDVAAAMPGGPQRRANLLALHDRAREFDHFSRQGLIRFLRFMDRLRERDGDLGSAPAVGAGEDVVRILSIHRSKGLEFPIVVVADLGKAWNEEDLRGDLLFHRRLGFGPRVVDRPRRVKYASLMHRAVAAERRLDARAEEMRVLYVALTRAREHLVLVGSARTLDERIDGWRLTGGSRDRLDEATLVTATSMLDWIAPAVMADLATPGISRAHFCLQSWGDAELRAALARSAPDRERAPTPDWEVLARLERPTDGEGSTPLPSRWAERFAWRYAHREATTRFAKMTVSELEQRFDPGPQDEESTPVQATEVVTRLRAPYAWIPSLAERPAFLERPAEGQALKPPSAAETGTATHLVMERLDLAGALDLMGVNEQVSALVGAGLLTSEQAGAVDLASVVDFFASDLGRHIVTVRAGVRRELPFTLGLPASEVHDGLGAADASDPVVVQGVIDLLAPADPGPGFVLVDFKTGGRGADLDERVASYRGQMALYRRAVEEILRAPVVECYLCFLDLRETRAL